MKRSVKDKVTVVGAGNVGATLAMRIVESGLADVALIDICKTIAEGKALDIADTCGMTGSRATIVGTDDWSRAEGSSVVAITAGFPRKPGMSREDLVAKNAAIVRDVVAGIMPRSREAVIIVVTNPLDAMTYYARRLGGFDRRKVVGMAGLLDESRFKALVARELGGGADDVDAVMMGSHGDTMVPIFSRARAGGRRLCDALPRGKIDGITGTARSRGAQIVGLLGSGSASYAPSLATYRMIEMILRDRHATATASAYLDGEYGLSDICIGVPVVLGRGGIEKIIELDLAPEESAALAKSADVIRQTIQLLPS